MLRFGGFILCSLAFIAQAGDGAARADDLRELSGTWAYTPSGCRDYLADRIESEARKRGVGLMIIRPAEIEWVTPASCRVANVRASGNRWDMDGTCELKGNDFSGRIAVTRKDRNRIAVRVDSDVTNRETLTYSRCSDATTWRDEQN